MNNQNWANKTIWTGDCLYIMRGMNSESVDLIYLDPPFNSKANYAAPIGSKAAGAAFKDTWTLTDIDVEWINLIETKHPQLYRVLLAAMTKSDKSYLVYMAARLLEMQRLLKPTGSIYLHCDPTMSHYLKLVMDTVFGKGNFKNELIWRRTSGRSDANRFGRVHDTILFYGNGKHSTWNTEWLPHDKKYISEAYKNVDERGHWQSDQLTASGLRSGESGQPWRGIDPGRVGNHWRTPTKGGMNDYIVEHNLITGWPEEYPSVHARLDALDFAGLISWPKKKNGMPRLKRYLDSTKGRAVDDVFVDIKRLEARSKERIGYPTQKPLALLNRIIKASSKQDDVVLDPFCGCATTCVAADDLGRKWVGIDISEKAAELVVDRIQERQGLFRDIIPRTDIPIRTDLGDIPRYNSRENRKFLYGEQGGSCAGCGTHFESQHLEVDHITSRNKGGPDHISNLQLLCSSCNRRKGDRGMEYLMARLQMTP